MRIIAGKHKKRRLTFFKQKEARPTQDRIREAVFNIIGDITGHSFLDLFAGTGGVGIEALSRGAEPVVCVEPKAGAIQTNVGYFPDEPITWVRQTAQFFIRSTTDKFDLVYVDPPWDKPFLFDHTLKLIHRFDILQADGKIIVESDKKQVKDWPLSDSISTHIYGRTQLTVIPYEARNIRG